MNKKTKIDGEITPHSECSKIYSVHVLLIFPQERLSHGRRDDVEL